MTTLYAFLVRSALEDARLQQEAARAAQRYAVERARYEAAYGAIEGECVRVDEPALLPGPDA